MKLSLAALVGLVVAAGLAAVAGPSTAAASQVIGQTAPTSAGCFTSSTYRQIGVSSGAAYSSPVNGVVTSWSTFGGPAAGQTLQLVSFHADPTGPSGRYIFDGADVVRDIAPNTLNTFGSGVRVPIVANGEIGVFVPFNSPASCLFAAPSATDAYAIGPGNAVVGGTADFVGSNPMSRVNASARVEPDADRDGYGDETQDCAPNDPKVHTGCRAAALRRCKRLAHKQNWSHKRLKKCRKRALRLSPI